MSLNRQMLACYFIIAIISLISLKCIRSYIISGYVKSPENKGIENVQIRFNDRGGSVTDASGYYEKKLPKGWSGTITPFKENFDFGPSSLSFSSLLRNINNVNYLGYSVSDPPAPPTNLRVFMKGTDAFLDWDDNSSFEDGFIIRRSLPFDTTTFIEEGRVPANTTKFTIHSLVPDDVLYKFLVSAFNDSIGESIAVRWVGKTPPAPPTNVWARLEIAREGFKYASLSWNDNSSVEDGFIIRRSMDSDTTKFIEVGRVPRDTTKFIILPLKPKTSYIYTVSAYNDSTGESFPQLANVWFPIILILPSPTDLIAIPTSTNSIFLTWKDNSIEEHGFEILRDGVIIDSLPRNTRTYLDTTGLESGITYSYLVRAFDDSGKFSAPSNIAKATTDTITALTHHSNGLFVDNKGGGAGGWSRFWIFNSDQLHDGHLQIWTGSDIVYDGDDNELTSQTSIKLYNLSAGPAKERTASASDPLEPVIMNIQEKNIEIKQFTYQSDDKNWVLIDWEVKNKATTPQIVKLAFFLDADIGDELSGLDRGGFDNNRKMVYQYCEENSQYLGIALVLEHAAFDSFQVSHFRDQRTPDNSNIIYNGEIARKMLLQKSEFYTGMLCGRSIDEPADLTMTLISNLGTILGGYSQRIFYAISVGKSLSELKGNIDKAENLAQSISTPVNNDTGHENEHEE